MFRIKTVDSGAYVEYLNVTFLLFIFFTFTRYKKYFIFCLLHWASQTQNGGGTAGNHWLTDVNLREAGKMRFSSDHVFVRGICTFYTLLSDGVDDSM